ncbi:23390_t:CDS:2, partial [Gigaspora margarita]
YLRSDSSRGYEEFKDCQAEKTVRMNRIIKILGAGVEEDEYQIFISKSVDTDHIDEVSLVDLNSIANWFKSIR